MSSILENMKQGFDFYKITMPDTRKADFYLGCLEGSVFLDINFSTDDLIYLRRISFDGYGCCNLDNISKNLDNDLSKEFVNEINKENIDQVKITKIVLELISLNIDYIWNDALEEYKFIDKK